MCKVDKKYVLLLAAESGDGQFRKLISKDLKQDFQDRDILIREAFFNDIDLNSFQDYDVIILMRSPMPGHSKYDQPKWKQVMTELETFTSNGGRLVMMFAESYGKSIGTFNQLGEKLNIKFLFNALQEEKNILRDKLPNMPEGKLIECIVSKEKCLKLDFEKINILTEGGHGTQHLTCLPGDDWEVLIKGSESCISQPYPDNNYANTGDCKISSPVLAATKKFGNGEVIAFPAASPFWLANASLKRWKQKILTGQDNAGYLFLENLLLYKNPQNRKQPGEDFLQQFSKPLLRENEFSYRYMTVDEKNEISKFKAWRTWISTLR